MEKVVNKLIYLYILFFSLSLLGNNDKEKRLKFIVLGHTYSTIKTDSLRTAYIDEINKENPDYVFILGDSNLDNRNIFNDFNTKITSKVLFSPGNHEIHSKSLLKNYINIVGYVNKTVIDKNCNFILLNSINTIENINDYLEEALKKINPKNPTVLLTHHRIWDDNLISNDVYGHEKMYFYNEISPEFRKKIDYIFAGNSSAQYFVGEKTNENIVFWADVVENTICYSVGMKYKINYTRVIVENKDLLVFPVTPIDLSVNKIKKIKEIPNISLASPQKTTKFKTLIHKLSSKTIWLTYFLGIFSVLFFKRLIKK